MNNKYWWKRSFFEQNFDRLFGHFVQYENIIGFFLTTHKLLKWKTVRVILGFENLHYSDEEIKILESSGFISTKCCYQPKRCRTSMGY